MGTPSEQSTNKMFGGITPNRKQLNKDFEEFWDKNAVNLFLDKIDKDTARINYLEKCYFGEGGEEDENERQPVL